MTRWVYLAFTFLASCGLLDPTIGALVVGDASVDASIDAPDAAACLPACALDAPDAGDACDASTTCEYQGTDAPCGVQLDCQSGVWHASGARTQVCEVADAGACGASLDTTEGAPCNAFSRCDFDGAVCACNSEGTFICEHATVNCPVPRRPLGTSCTTDVVCTNYVDIGCGFLTVCRDCVWQAQAAHTCP